MKWIQFGEKLPTIGDRIKIKFPDDDRILDYGRINSIIELAEGKWWSLNSESYVGSAVRAEYLWCKVK